MDSRKLKPILAVCRQFGVKSYTSADLTVQFADTPTQVSGADVEGTDDLMLPDGVPDARAMLDDITRAYQKPAKRRGRAA